MSDYEDASLSHELNLSLNYNNSDTQSPVGPLYSK